MKYPLAPVPPIPPQNAKSKLWKLDDPNLIQRKSDLQWFLQQLAKNNSPFSGDAIILEFLTENSNLNFDTLAPQDLIEKDTEIKAKNQN